MSDPTPHETPEAEEVEALTSVLHARCVFAHNPEHGTPPCQRGAETVLAAGYRKAHPARDAELRAGLTKADVALARWEASGPTSLTVALCVEALYDLRATLTEAGGES